MSRCFLNKKRPERSYKKSVYSPFLMEQAREELIDYVQYMVKLAYKAGFPFKPLPVSDTTITSFGAACTNTRLSAATAVALVGSTQIP